MIVDGKPAVRVEKGKLHMMRYELFLLAGVLFAGCLSQSRSVAVRRVESADPALWVGAKWIAAADARAASDEDRHRGRSADGTSWFCRGFRPTKPVRSARLAASGLGVFELYVNGMKVGGEDVLKPGFTHGRKTKYAFVYDVTGLIAPGTENRLVAEVSHGWWSDKVAGYAGKVPAFLAALELVYEDGGVERILTDGSWRGAVAGSVVHAGVFDGEEYDARVPQPVRGDDAWPAAKISGEFAGEVLPTAGAEIVARDDLAVSRGPFRLAKGETLVVDFGQNMAGVPEFVFRAAKGTVLTALPGEMLNDAPAGERGSDGPKGSVYRANLRNPDHGMRVVYTFAGLGRETYRPRFTFFGFRHLSITATDEVEIERVAAVPVTSIAKRLETGRLTTGDAAVNRLVANVYWGQLSNYLSVPTDCPQRNERQGWTADTQVFAEAGAFNADTCMFLRKWMRDMRDTQRDTGAFTGVAPFGCYGDAGAMRLGWQDAGVIVPYCVWRQFGDRAVIDENWAAMDRFFRHIADTRMDMAEIGAECGNYQWADWLSFERLESCDGGGRPDFCAFVTDAGGKRAPRPEAVRYWNYLGACYWLWDAEMMAEMAGATGRDRGFYERSAEAAKAYLKEKFFSSPDGMIDECFRDMQTPALFALKLGLVEGGARVRTISALRENFRANGNCLKTGFLGTSILMDTLTECGMTDLAYDILLGHSFPGWLYSVDQGATTIWERWNSYTKDRGFGPVGMNSFNHYAYGSVLAWLYKTAAGIASDSAAPGFVNIVMAPRPDRRLGFVDAEYRSRAGVVKSSWKYVGDVWRWTFTVPEGATADVTLPGETKSVRYRAGTYTIEK